MKRTYKVILESHHWSLFSYDLRYFGFSVFSAEIFRPWHFYHFEYYKYIVILLT